MGWHSPEALLERFCSASDRLSLAIVAAHPDDEVIGASYCLLRFRCPVIHVTDGAPRSMHDANAAGFTTRLDYARARREECKAALAIAGLMPDRLHELGFIDQEASLHLIDLVQQVVAIIREIRPLVVVTHPYEGGHPDHDASAFAVHGACRLLAAQDAPVIIEMTSYHNRSGEMVVGEFLPAWNHSPVRTVILSDAERALKRRMLDSYVTQKAVVSLFPLEWERFRLAPRYDFSQAPHPGQLFYERFDWGMTGSHWRGLAQAALATLGLDKLLWR